MSNEFWLGSVDNNCFMDAAKIRQFPGITAIARKFHEFQNSPYRGEWQQKLPITAGEMQDALREIAGLLVAVGAVQEMIDEAKEEFGDNVVQ